MSRDLGVLFQRTLKHTCCARYLPGRATNFRNATTVTTTIAKGRAGSGLMPDGDTVRPIPSITRPAYVVQSLVKTHRFREWFHA